MAALKFQSLLRGLPDVRTVGVPREIKPNEFRVGLTPAGASELRKIGKRVYVEHNAGLGSGFTDIEYMNAGAIIDSASNVWGFSDMVIKVKEPYNDGKVGGNEFKLMRQDQILFTYLHLAASKDLAEMTANTGVTAVAYETVVKSDGSIPMLAPMSRIAGIMAPQEAAAIGTWQGAAGLLMCDQEVLVIGGGNVGCYAAVQAMNMGAKVRIFDIDIDKPRAVIRNIAARPEDIHVPDDVFERIAIEKSKPISVYAAAMNADTIITAPLRPGAPAPKVLNDSFFAAAYPGQIVVDVSIDQGGATTRSKATTHERPIYIVDRNGHAHEFGDYSTPGTVMYCVANMPGKHARTATIELTQATLPYALAIAKGLDTATFEQYPELFGGFNTFDGKILLKQIAEPLGLTGMLMELER